MARLDVIAEEGTTLVAAHFLLQRIEVAEDALRGGQAVLPAVERLQIGDELRSEEHTSELQSLMRISYAVFCLKNKTLHPTSCKQTCHPAHTHTGLLTLLLHPQSP